jgi:uncharacterized protein
MIASPCINVCKMDAQTGLCTGCFRTIDEITVWSRIDDRRRVNILAAVAQRRLQQEPREVAFCSDASRHE